MNLKGWWILILLSIVLMVAGGALATRVGLDSDLEGLLPSDAESVKNLNVIESKSGGTRDIKLLIYGGSFAKRVEAAEAFKSFLEEKYPHFARSIRFKTPKPFFEEHKFKLIPIDSLDAILRRIERERRANAAFTDPLGLEETIENTDAQARGEMAAEGTQVTSRDSAPSDDDDMKYAEDLLQRLDAMHLYYQTKDEQYLAVRVIPAAESFNIQRNRELLSTFDAHVREFKFERFDPEIRTEFYGTIYNHVSRFDSIANDVSFGGIGILIILILVAIYFRSLWALLTTVPPLLAGLAVGMGTVGLMEKDLNSIAIFLVLVVFGVGIEFGIHLWSRYLDERRGAPLGPALETTWRTTGRATLTSSTALLCGFALLTVSSFQGFAQFGRVAIVLVVAAAGSFVLFMPAWIILVEKMRREKSWRSSLAEVLVMSRLRSFWPPRGLMVMRWVSLAVVVIGAVLCIKYFRFDYGFAEDVKVSVDTPARRSQHEIFSERLSPSAIAVFKTNEEAAKFMDFYRLNKKSYPEIHLMSGLPSFLPIDQPSRIAKIQTIADELEPEWIERFTNPLLRKALKEMKGRAYEERPIELSDIPPETREPFIASDGSGDSMVFIFDEGGDTDGRKAIKFREEVERFIHDSNTQPLMSGNQIIFADIVNRVISEGPWLVLGMFLLVFLICWLDFRSLKDACITLAPVVCGFILTGTILVLEGTMINFFNMVALASLGAMVVDNSIHMFHRYKEYRSEGRDDADHLATISVGPPVFVCTLTSICGYGGMAFANHNGIASLGLVAILGLSACFVASVIFFPAWLKSFR